MRRKRRLFDLGVVAATVALLPVTVLALWSCGWYSAVASPVDPDTPLGESHGIVWKVEPSTSVVRVSPSWSGIGAVPFALTRETRILVGDKEGGFGDVYAGRPIKIVYERREDTMIALCVELHSGRDRDSDRCRTSAPPGDLASTAPTVAVDAPPSPQ